MNDDAGLTEWLKWITGGLLAIIALIWQWMDRKVDALNARIDTLRKEQDEKRHALETKITATILGVDGDLDDLKDRVTRGENRPGGSGKQ